MVGDLAGFVAAVFKLLKGEESVNILVRQEKDTLAYQRKEAYLGGEEGKAVRR